MAVENVERRKRQREGTANRLNKITYDRHNKEKLKLVDAHKEHIDEIKGLIFPEDGRNISPNAVNSYISNLKISDNYIKLFLKVTTAESLYEAQLSDTADKWLKLVIKENKKDPSKLISWYVDYVSQNKSQLINKGKK